MELNDYQKRILDKAQKLAGPRYSPELNIELPIAKIFDGLGRTKIFFEKIKRIYGEIARAYSHSRSKEGLEIAQESYTKIKNAFDKLLPVLAKIDSSAIKPIDFGKIATLSEESQKLCWDCIEVLRNAKVPKPPNQHFSEPLGSEKHYLYELTNSLREIVELAKSESAKLANTPFLLLIGRAGTGKTHLFCDVADHRIKSRLPTFLFLGEQFDNSDLWTQIIQLLNLPCKNKEELLKTLNEAGKSCNSRVLILIDALNEGKRKDIWKKHISKIVNDIRQYPYIGLAVSIRTGYEKAVLTKSQISSFIQVEHHGFQFKEWEAVTKFFKIFNLKLLDIPLLVPEFQNPLLLKLFCQTYKGQTKLLRGHLWGTHLFEDYVIKMGNEICKELKLLKGKGYNGKSIFWDLIIKKIAEWMGENGTDAISPSQVSKIVEKMVPGKSREILESMEKYWLLTKGTRFTKKWKRYGYEYRFPYNKFSDHLIVRYLLNKHLNTNSPQQSFLKSKKLGEIKNFGLIEALAIQIPERLKGTELMEVTPTEFSQSQIAQETFLESLIWRDLSLDNSRKPKFIRRNTVIKLVNTYIIKDKYLNDKFLNVLLTVASIPEHPLNADFLHKHLMRFKLAKRDAWWSVFLHYQYEERGAVDRLVEWAWSETDKNHISDKSIRLCSVALAWFLTTPNRFLRDRATKALVSLLADRLHIIQRLLRQFKDVNDPYVSERLYAVAYGAGLRNSDNKGLKELAQDIYDQIFKDGTPPPHILLRDYAQGVIKVAMCRGIDLKIDIAKIKPPYKSDWPNYILSDEEIEKFEFDYKSKDFKDHYWSQNSIISSMKTEHSGHMYGDFGRYVFQSAFRNWRKLDPQELSNLAVKRVFELGYDVEKHGEFDRNINRYSYTGRTQRKPERIGKKYQWIAFHEILARVSDNFTMYDEVFGSENKPIPYEGPWQLWVRDIDPSSLLRVKPQNNDTKNNRWWHPVPYDAWESKKRDKEWIRTTRDIPNPRDVIEVIDKSNQRWLMLNGFVEWKQETPPEEKEYDIPRRRLWYMINSYIIKKSDLEKIFNWAKIQHFWGRWMPESHEFLKIFIREYPWAKAFLYHNIPYYGHDIWTRGNDGKIPKPVLVTNDEYLQEDEYDCSIDESLHTQLPAKWLIDEMKLIPTKTDGEYTDSNGNIICFDPSIKSGGSGALLIAKDYFIRFLNENGYDIFWTLLGEKGIIGGSLSEQGGWKGSLELSGAYRLVKDSLKGKITSKLKLPSKR